MITRFHTENSIYDVDYTNNVYRRLPNRDTRHQPLETRNPQGSHRLVDNSWLPLCSDRQAYLEGDCLRIFAPDSTFGIYTSVVQTIEEGNK